MLLYRAFYRIPDNYCSSRNVVIQGVLPYTWQLLLLKKCCYTGRFTVYLTIIAPQGMLLYRAFYRILDNYCSSRNAVIQEVLGYTWQLLVIKKCCNTGRFTVYVTIIRSKEMLLYKTFHIRHNNYWSSRNAVIQGALAYTWQLLVLKKCCYTGRFTVYVTIIAPQEMLLYRKF